MHFSFRKHFCVGGVVVLSLFLLAADWYIDKKNRQDIEQFVTHAYIIADEVWAVDRTGVETYLQLAASLNSFKSISVSELDGEIFVAVKGPSLDSFNSMLVRTKLMSVRHLAADILYKGERIAVLEGDRYVHLFFPLINIFIVILLVAVTIIFLRYLFATRYFLQKLVVDRTQKLRESECRFEDLVNLLPEMVWETDLQGCLTYMNQVGRQRLGVVVDGMSSYFDLLDPAARKQAEIKFQAAILGHESGLQELYALEKESGRFPLLLRCSPRFRHGQVVGMRMLGVDISERIKLEDQLQRDRRMKALGLMAGGVAHDLNNILSGVVGYPDLLLQDISLDPKLRAPLEAIKKSGMGAAEVVSDLLTVVRGGVVNRELICIKDVVQEYFDSPECRTLQQANPLVEYSTVYSYKVAIVSCSAMHIRKTLMNLVINSTEAIDGVGKITVITRIENSRESLSCHNTVLEPGSYVCLTVRDTGVGIAEEDIDHIFEPFYTKKVMGKSGTGLGMALVWNTVMDHNGGIRLLSDAAGTVVELYFPNHLEDQESAVLDPVYTTGKVGDASYISFKGHGQKILVVDDEPQQRDVAVKMLTLLGYSVGSVHSGEEAVAYVRRTPVDCIVLDMLMPPGMNGYETYAEIVTQYPGQKAVIASGYAEVADVNSAMDLGVCGIVHKPYTIEEIGGMVQDALKE